jgi:hypothetical protein
MWLDPSHICDAIVASLPLSVFLTDVRHLNVAHFGRPL